MSEYVPYWDFPWVFKSWSDSDLVVNKCFVQSHFLSFSLLTFVHAKPDVQLVTMVAATVFSVLQCCNRHCIFLLFSSAFCYHCSECAHSTLFWRTDHYLVTRTATLSVWGREDVVICHLLFRSSSTTPVHRIGVVPYACKLQLMISTNRSGVGSEAPQTECKPVPMLTLIAWQQT